MASRHVGGGRSIGLSWKGRPSGGVEAGAGPTARNLEGAYPIEGDLNIENDGVGAFHGALADGGTGVADPRR